MRRLSAAVGGALALTAGFGTASSGQAALVEYDMQLFNGRFFPGVNYHLPNFQTISADPNTTARDVDLTSGVFDFDFLNTALTGSFSYDSEAAPSINTETFSAYTGNELAIDVSLPVNGEGEGEGEGGGSSVAATILKNDPRITLSQSGFNHNISISSSFEPFDSAITLENIDTPTITVDLLNDSQFLAEAPDIPDIPTFPVRLTHPATMDLEVTSVLIRDNSRTALDDRQLPARIDLTQFPDSVFIIQFTGDLGVAVDPGDYDSQEDFDLAAQWVNDHLESVEARAIGNYDILSITGGIPDGQDPRVPFLPDTIVGPTGGFFFDSMVVTSGRPWFFDPVVAVGYDYEITEGPLVVEVTVQPVGDQTQFLISVPGVFENQPIFADVPFDLTTAVPSGVGAFTISGIDPEAGLDPADPTAFVTGLAFAEDGVVSLSMTPLTVPEPAALTLLALGMATLARRRR